VDVILTAAGAQGVPGRLEVDRPTKKAEMATRLDESEPTRPLLGKATRESNGVGKIGHAMTAPAQVKGSWLMSLERPLIAAKQSRVMQCLFGQPRGTDGGKQPHAQPRRASLLPETFTSIFLLISLERVFRLRFLLAIEERAMSWMSCLKSSLNGGRPCYAPNMDSSEYPVHAGRNPGQADDPPPPSAERPRKERFGHPIRASMIGS
jgi:hypothetical protein